MEKIHSQHHLRSKMSLFLAVCERHHIVGESYFLSPLKYLCKKLWKIFQNGVLICDSDLFKLYFSGTLQIALLWLHT